MNLAVEQTSPDLHAALVDAKRRRADARAHAAALDERVRNATASVEAARADFEHRTEEKAADMVRRSRHIDQWWRAGHQGSPPSVVPDVAAENQLLAADYTLTASRTALASLVADRDAARLELQGIDAEVAAVADAILGQEAEAQAESIIDEAEAVIAMGRQLSVTVPSGAHIPLNQIRLDAPSPQIEKALEICRRIQVGTDLHTRIDVLRGLTDDLADERAALVAHRQELIDA